MPRRAVYRLPRSLLAALGEEGLDVGALAAGAGLGEEALRGPVDAAAAERFLALALGRVGDPGFGLRVGARVRPELFGVVGLLALSSATYGETLARIARYKRLVSGERLELAPAGPGSTALRVSLGEAGGFARMRLDAALAFLVSLGRLLTGRPLRPERVSISSEPPAHRERYAALFGCEVSFGAPGDELVLFDADLALPLASRDPELAPLLEARAEGLLRESGGPVGVGDRVREELRRSLGEELPGVREVARRLALSERTLQRKLREERASFQGLVAEVRLELARRYLSGPPLGGEEISYLLGFAHPNSFYRAFKRWTGVTPDEYRGGRRGRAGEGAAGR